MRANKVQIFSSSIPFILSLHLFLLAAGKLPPPPPPPTPPPAPPPPAHLSTTATLEDDSMDVRNYFFNFNLICIFYFFNLF